MELFGKILLICIVSVAATDALQCHTCEHRRPDLNNTRSPTTCETGKKPKSAFLEECEKQEYVYFSLGSGKFLGVPKNSGLKNAVIDNESPVSIPQQTQNATYSCYKLTMSGKETRGGNQSDLAITSRGCLQYLTGNGTNPEKCYDGLKSKLITEIQELQIKEIVEFRGLQFTDDPNVGICSCNGDECNGAMNSVAVSVSLILVATAFSIFRRDL
ncbi:unnamed protein product [Orchesella dallaii]|uniref:Protein sleepless n=1 Tax=Orchesella dallaii TaxID=48710 RepID=A0ABP1RLZ6_9HEXA